MRCPDDSHVCNMQDVDSLMTMLTLRQLSSRHVHGMALQTAGYLGDIWVDLKVLQGCTWLLSENLFR